MAQLPVCVGAGECVLLFAVDVVVDFVVVLTDDVVVLTGDVVVGLGAVVVDFGAVVVDFGVVNVDDLAEVVVGDGLRDEVTDFDVGATDFVEEDDGLVPDVPRARIFAAACSATATMRADGLVLTRPGKMDASTTKS